MGSDEDSRMIAMAQVLNFFKIEEGWTVAVLGKGFARSFREVIKMPVMVVEFKDGALVSHKGRVDTNSVDMFVSGESLDGVSVEMLKNVLWSLKPGSVAIFIEKAGKKEELEEKYKDKLDVFPKHLILNLSQYHNGILLKK